jgi:hypothetical protein
MAKYGNTRLSKMGSWQVKMIAFDDPELNEWLMQAIEEGSGQFLSALAEAALIACAEDYLLVRPVLISLKRTYGFASPAARYPADGDSREGRRAAATGSVR